MYNKLDSIQYFFMKSVMSFCHWSHCRTFLLLLRCCGLGFLCLCLLPSTTPGQEKVTIFFYSAEANINNFKSLKMEFDKYLTQFGRYEFQPFSDRTTFEEHVKGKTHSLLLLSSWHYTHIYRDYALQPILVGLRNGQTSQKRVLVTLGEADNINAVKTGPIASASSVQHTQSLLSSMFDEDEASANFKILTVPKDIDALMSVGFGMAKFAVITENSLETLQGINPPLYKKLKIVAESEETLLLIIAAPENLVSEAQEVVSILQEMAVDPDGEKRVRMLGLDGWQSLDPSEKAKLEGVNNE